MSASPSDSPPQSWLRLAAGYLDNLAHQRKPVRMNPRRSQCDEAVTGNDAAAIDDAILVDDANAKSCQIESPRPGRFRAFPRSRRRSARNRPSSAAVSNAVDDLLGLGDLELPGRVIIQKKECLGAEYRDIIRAHRHQVDADAINPVKVDGQSQLGADTVGARYQQRIAIAIQWQFEQAAETADAAHATFAPGCL